MPNSTNLSFSPYYFTVAFAFPFVPTAILVSVYMTLDNMVELKVTPFYCTIINPIWLTAAWFAVFGVVGMCSAIVLLNQTIWRRDKMIKFGQTTHFPCSAILRLSLKVIVYCFLCIGSFLPLMLYSFKTSNEPPAPPPTEDVGGGGDDSSSDYTETRIADHQNDPHYITEPILSCFIPALLGMGFFIMYGVSAHALLIYRKIFKHLKKRLRKRKKSHDLEMRTIKPKKYTPSSNQITPMSLNMEIPVVSPAPAIMITSNRRSSVMEEIVFRTNPGEYEEINLSVLRTKPKNSSDEENNLNEIVEPVEPEPAVVAGPAFSRRKTFNSSPIEEIEMEEIGLNRSRSSLPKSADDEV